MKLIKKMVGLLYNLLGLPYYAVLWTIKNTIKVLKSIPMYSNKGIKLIIKTIKNLLLLIIKPLKWIWKIIKGINTKGILIWIIDVIKEYVEENNIERAIDIVVRTVANKKNNKIYIDDSDNPNINIKINGGEGYWILENKNLVKYNKDETRMNGISLIRI